MKKFIVIYHAPADAMKTTEGQSEEDMKKGMEAWMQWAAKVGDGLVDLGTPLANGQRVTKEGSSPSTKEVVGYSILQAEDMEAAKKLLEGHPHLEWAEACDIEIHESLPLPK